IFLECIKSLKRPQLIGDIFYDFKCSVCCKGKEIYTRTELTWINCLQIVIYNIIISKRKEENNDSIEYCKFKEDICKFIDDNWEYFYPNKPHSYSWIDIISNILNLNSSIFKSGYVKFRQEGWWSLKYFRIPRFGLGNK
ncbi:hypothetical protein BCR36DRAFT_277598, partial [Piromyces finnis]